MQVLAQKKCRMIQDFEAKLPTIYDNRSVKTFVVALGKNMKHFRYLMTLVAGLGLLLALSVLPAAAAGSTASTTAPTNTGPADAALIQGQTMTIPGSSSLWFKFDYPAPDYAGNNNQRSTAIVVLPNGTGSGLGFKVYSPEQINDWWDVTPMGQGTAQTERASNDTPADNGSVLSADLSWQGSMGEGGPYYVEVTNSNTYPSSFQLNFQLLNPPAQP
jgi:hypothetical protein